MASETTDRLSKVIANLERVQKGLCCYMGPTCDCKYGFPSDTRPGTEQTGCPELRDAIGFLRQLQRLMAVGDTLLTYEEWNDVNRALRISPEAQQETLSRSIHENDCRCEPKPAEGQRHSPACRFQNSEAR